MGLEYFAPKSLSEALSLLRTWKGKAKVIAGGTNMIPDMKEKVPATGALVDLSRLKTLSYIKEEKRRIRLGALTTISEITVSKVIQRVLPILSEASGQLGNPLVRNRATIGGNLANASPAADTAVPLLALGAVVITERFGSKPKEIPVDRFFLGPNQTVLKRDEIIREIVFPKREGDVRMAYFKLGLRSAMAISLVSLAIVAEFDEEELKEVRIGVGAVGPRPMRAYRVEEALSGKKVTRGLIEACCQMVKEEVSPISDIRGSAEYRRLTTSVLLKRGIEKVLLEREN
jgi:CO/xanthine dehydrogenase FAD-binding subunit